MHFRMDLLRGKAFTIAVNAAHLWAKWADVRFSIDTQKLNFRFPTGWRGKTFIGAPADFGQVNAKFGCDRVDPRSDFQLLKRIDEQGLSESPDEVAGLNSAFGALNFAYHLKPKRIFLFGVDGTHLSRYFYGRRYSNARTDRYMLDLPEIFRSAVPQLALRGIDVINASVSSAVNCFPKMGPAAAAKLV